MKAIRHPEMVARRIVKPKKTVIPARKPVEPVHPTAMPFVVMVKKKPAKNVMIIIQSTVTDVLPIVKLLKRVIPVRIMVNHVYRFLQIAVMEP